MKKILVALCLASLSISSYAVTLIQFSVIRDGGGQIEASIANSDEGLEITLIKCNFRAAAEGITKKVTGQTTVDHALAILNGEAIIATDVTPRPMMPTGSWQSMGFSFNSNQLPEVSARHIITKKVASPLIIVNNEVSDVLMELEIQARTLCKH